MGITYNIISSYFGLETVMKIKSNFTNQKTLMQLMPVTKMINCQPKTLQYEHIHSPWKECWHSHRQGRTTPRWAPAPKEDLGTPSGSRGHSHHTAAVAPLGHTHGTPKQRDSPEAKLSAQIVNR